MMITPSVLNYISQLPKDRKDVVKKVRQLILEYIPEGYQEVLNWGMICCEIPLQTFPDTYNSKPLMYIGLLPNKNHISLHLMDFYWDSDLVQSIKEDFQTSGRKLNMGKSCIRLKSLNDNPKEAISEIIASTTPQELIQNYKRTMAQQ